MQRSHETDKRLLCRVYLQIGHIREVSQDLLGAAFWRAVDLEPPNELASLALDLGMRADGFAEMLRFARIGDGPEYRSLLDSAEFQAELSVSERLSASGARRLLEEQRLN